MGPGTPGVSGRVGCGQAGVPHPGAAGALAAGSRACWPFSSRAHPAGGPCWTQAGASMGPPHPALCSNNTIYKIPVPPGVSPRTFSISSTNWPAPPKNSFSSDPPSSMLARIRAISNTEICGAECEGWRAPAVRRAGPSRGQAQQAPLTNDWAARSWRGWPQMAATRCRRMLLPLTEAGL